MIELRHLQLLLSALSMESKGPLSDESIYERYQTLVSSGGESALVDLWKDLKSVPCACDWPESEYQPGFALKKRALLLSRKVVDGLKDNLPTHVDFEPSEDFKHLVMHGKLGLMALLFSLQESHASLKGPDFSPMIEAFMTHIETLTEELLFSESAPALAKALALPVPSGEVDILTWVRGRLQPFALMRSVYLEEPARSMGPLEWWVSHERYIPALPEC